MGAEWATELFLGNHSYPRLNPGDGKVYLLKRGIDPAVRVRIPSTPSMVFMVKLCAVFVIVLRIGRK